jgi:hypothetical protein
MRRSLFVLTVALILVSMMGIAAGPSWGQQNRGCDDHEGDHGRGCLPTTQDECQDSGWLLFNMFKNEFVCTSSE